MKYRLTKFNQVLVTSVASLVLSCSALAAKPEPTLTWTDPALAEQDHSGFKYMGEYVNQGRALQVSPQGNKYYVADYAGGLPGLNWNGQEVRYALVTETELLSLLTDFSKIDRGMMLVRGWSGSPNDRERVNFCTTNEFVSVEKF